MTVYLDLVVLLNFSVDFLLMIGTNRLCGCPMKPGKCAVAAAVGGVYAGMCLIPGFSFLGNRFWSLIALAGMILIAFGRKRSALKRGILFVFLSMALGGIALYSGTEGIGGLFAAALGVMTACLIGFSGRAGGAQYVAVKLTRAGKKVELTALRDTGNQLKDPISGQQVLVAGPEAAKALMGLTQEELSRPVETMAALGEKGLRLIPYRAVGNSAGMLLAARMDEVIVGGEKWGDLVAFAPQQIGPGEEYQALAGGVL